MNDLSLLFPYVQLLRQIKKSRRAKTKRMERKGGSRNSTCNRRRRRNEGGAEAKEG